MVSMSVDQLFVVADGFDDLDFGVPLVRALRF